MKEILRTGDPVKLSWISALMAGENIETVILDTHMSFAEGSISAIPRRIMVANQDYDAAIRLLADAGEIEADTDKADTLLGGQVGLYQPEGGYRVAVDPVLLAASVPAASAERLLDIGTGSGAAALCFAHRVPGSRVTGLELHPEMAALARRNVELNDMKGCVAILEGDLLRPPRELEGGGFDHVIANPPYLPAERADPPPDALKAVANIEGEATLSDWVDFAIRMCKPRGAVTFVHRADRLDELLFQFHGRAGGIVIFPLWPKPGREAKRVIVRARPGVKTPTRLSPGLLLHNDDGDYTEEAMSILRDGGALTL